MTPFLLLQALVLLGLVATAVLIISFKDLLAAAGYDLPPRRSTWERPALRSDPYAAAFRDQLERVKPTPKVLEWERIVQEMRLTSERVVRGGQSQDAAVRQLDARVDALLEKRRWVEARRMVSTEAAP